MKLRRFFAVLLLACLPLAALAAPGLRPVASMGGVTEYRLANGLQVLLVPDAGADTVTVHVAYRVGSRNEGYGEKGMAHLLEHLMFKGSKAHPDVKAELGHRGARWNATTSDDRTTYFETLAATDANLAWAIAMEADRMTRAFIAKPALDSEMTVVRNEFEMGENDPGTVLYQRMEHAAFFWHNYGNPVIGARSDIENVPISRLQAFYRTWYRPDNAIVTIGGRFEPRRALELVQASFGALERPAKPMPRLYTVEPTQDGERAVTLRRVGDNPIVAAMYRVPAGSDPQYPALEVLVQVLGDSPSGRLHKALVEKGLASWTWGWERGLRDAGLAYFGAGIPKGAPLEPVREALLATLEGLKARPVTEAEVSRARTQLLNDLEQTQLKTAPFVHALAEFAAIGDWRLFFLHRRELEKVDAAAVQRAAEAYLLRSNRVLGEYVPTAQPERAHIPPPPDVEKRLAGFSGGEALQAGEAFDPTPQNIEARVIRRTLPNDIHLAMLPRKTRGSRVVLDLSLHLGDLESRANRGPACEAAGNMLIRGTTQHTRAELQDAFDRLNADVSVGAGGASVEVRRPQLAETLRLLAEVLRRPSFPEGEFEQMKRAAITSVASEQNDPSSLAAVRLARHLRPYPKGHPRYTRSIDEQIEALRRLTLEEAKACYRDLFGATHADVAAVGDFDPEALAKEVAHLFGGWKSPQPFARVPARYFEREPLDRALATPDRPNAVLRAGLSLPMRDDDPDFPAMALADYLLGGSSTARIPARVREKEGLSYSTYTSFSASPFDRAATFGVSSIFAPQNRDRVEQAIREELELAVREGFTPQEVEAAKKAYLERRRLARTQDRALAQRLSAYLYVGRTFAWDLEFERRIAGLDAAAVNAALRRHLDPARLSVIAAGDFKKRASARPQSSGT